MTIRDKIKKNIKEDRMFQAEDIVLVGVSGGADSICLLDHLYQLQGEFDICLKAMHIHHGLRGEEADRDAVYVTNYCKERGIDCQIRYVDVKSLVKESGQSTEEAARNLRYEEFMREMGSLRKQGYRVKLALAHNKEDSAETFLFNLVRGSGLKGLSGITKQNDTLCRPLLNISRKEIEAYLEKENIEYCTDSSNLTNEYSRNIIRHDILPRFISDINSSATDHILQGALHIRMAEEFISDYAHEIYKKYIVKDAGYQSFTIDILKHQKSIIRTYIIRYMIEDLQHTKKDIGNIHILDIEKLLYVQSGKKIDLPYGMEAVREYENLIIRKKTGTVLQEVDIEFRIFAYNGEKIPDSDKTKWLDYDKIGELPSKRYRKSGDYITLRMSNRIIKKKLKDYMIDAKIPRRLRDGIPLLAIGDEIVYIVGHRLGERCKVGADTKNILEIKII